MMSRVLLMSFLCCWLLAAQTGTKVDLQNQARGVDFSAATYTKPAKTGTALPSTCSTGEAYVLTTAVAGANFYICTATNTWTVQASTGTTDHSKLTHLDYASSGHTGFQAALGYTPIDSATLGQANGPAQLGSDGKIPSSELPSSLTSSTAAVSFTTDQFTGTGSTVYTLSATPITGSLIVTVNGQVQEAGTLADYVQSGTNITFASSSMPASGARVSFRYAVATGSGSTLTVGFATDQATGDGSTAAFTLTNTPLAGALTVVVNGQIQEPGTSDDYTLSGNTVTFTTPAIPSSGARISFHYGYSTVSSASTTQISMSQLPAGIPNGLATLGSDGKVLSSQLPASTGGTSTAATTGMQAFTASGTFTVPSGVSRVLVQAWGAGAGGTAGNWASGGGGSGGGYAQAWCTVTAGAAVTVTVGAGGTGGTNSANPTGGGNSSFGTCATATGGSMAATDPNVHKPGYDAALGNVRALYYGTDSSGGSAKLVLLSALYAGTADSTYYVALRYDTGGVGAPNAGNTGGFAGGDAIYGGGGGGGGPRDDTKGNQAAGTGGNSGFGGSGGNSGSISSSAAQACTAGTAPGGGGGGGAWDGSTYLPGCNGARGEVRVWW